MPSNNIVRGIRAKIQNQLVPAIPGRWQKQFSFGLQAYGLKAFQSASGNARTVGVKAATAIRKKERLFQNEGLADQLVPLPLYSIEFINVPENPGLSSPGMNGSLEQIQSIVSA